MKRTKLLILSAMVLVATSLNAAVLTTQLKIEFNGTASGATYTLGAGEFVNNGTFSAAGTPAVSGGIADLTGGANGFFYNTTLPNIKSGNWVAEAWVDFDSFIAEGTILGVEGDTNFVTTIDSTTLRVVYWDGVNSSFVNVTKPPVNTLQHLALVWNGSDTSLTGYVNGVQVAFSNKNVYLTPDANFISFGYNHRVNSRGIDGQLSAIAFSTFTGTFDPNSDFVLIPEPSSLALSSGFLIMLLAYRRRQSSIG